jgi:aryl-alcohol dehydrogenase-like predicted oxidoreductase
VTGADGVRPEPSMRSASLGPATITRIGLGSWAMGGSGWVASLGPQDDGDSMRTIAAALEAGINWIDTAPVYGLGRAEEVIGAALAAMPDDERPLVFTKCGLIWGEDGDPREILSPASIRRECDASLRRLRRERLDLLQVHWPAQDGTPVEESWAAMADLVTAGKVRWIGVSNYDVAMLDLCERIRHVDTLQPSFSMLRRTAGEDLIPWCVAHGTAVLAYSPLESGLLAGSFTADRVAGLDTEDVRLERTIFRPAGLARSLDAVARLRAIAAEAGWSLAELACAWALDWPGVTAIICGARTPRQLSGWVRAAGLELAPELRDAITEALVATGAGSGPVRPAEVGVA